VKLLINPSLCQGHGRCYYIAPDLFRDDEEGYGQIRGPGAVPQDKEREARLAVANCPKRAIGLLEEVSHDGP
jgi:ferredoxin